MTDILDLVDRQRELLTSVEVWQGIRDRSHLYEYADIELALIDRFNRARSANTSSRQVEVEGFVSIVGGRRFILRPSLAVNYGLLCDASSIRSLPRDYEFVRVEGYRTLLQKTSRYAGKDRLTVTALERIRLPAGHLKPELSMKDAEETLMEGYADLPPQLKRNILSSVISSPGDASRIGGLTTALIPLEESYSRSQYGLLQDLKRSIPRDLTSGNRLKISVEGAGEFVISPFPWGLHNTSDSLWNSTSDAKLFSRTADGLALSEMTLGFSATRAIPRSLDEIWIRQSDFPTLVDANVYRHASPPSGFDLRLAKYLITVHTNRPYVDKTVDANLTRMVTPRLVRLRRDYDSRGYGGLIDLDTFTGNPRSILSIAKTIARAEGSESVKEDHVDHALAQFVDSREDVFEAWAEMGQDLSHSQVSPRKKLQRIGHTAERVYKYIADHPDSSRSEIREALPKVQERIFNDAINEMVEQRLIYRSSTHDERYSVVYASW